MSGQYKKKHKVARGGLKMNMVKGVT